MPSASGRVCCARSGEKHKDLGDHEYDAPLWPIEARQTAGRVGADGHWRTTTFIGALRSDALTALAFFDGAINGESFRPYVQQVLVPTL